jgi:hypothetical protein
VRLVTLDELAGRFDVEFAFDREAAAPVVLRFLEALRQVTGKRNVRPASAIQRQGVPGPG